jgi:hypothetical protein
MIPKKIKIYRASENSSVDNEGAPVTQELRQIFEVAPLRARVMCSMMAFRAFRPQVFGNLVADDGLKIGDLPEMKIEHEVNERGGVVGGTVSFESCERSLSASISSSVDLEILRNCVCIFPKIYRASNTLLLDDL